jgi:hypothetical protein
MGECRKSNRVELHNLLPSSNIKVFKLTGADHGPNEKWIQQCGLKPERKRPIMRTILEIILKKDIKLWTKFSCLKIRSCGQGEPSDSIKGVEYPDLLNYCQLSGRILLYELYQLPSNTLLFTSHYPKRLFIPLKSQSQSVRVTFQLTVSQLVCLGVEPNLGLLTRDIIIIIIIIFFFF